MPRIELYTEIKADRKVVFDLSMNLVTKYRTYGIQDNFKSYTTADHSYRVDNIMTTLSMSLAYKGNN